MPIDVTVEEPWSRIVSDKSDRDVVARLPVAHDVADDGIVKVISRVTSAADDVEGVTMHVNRVLE